MSLLLLSLASGLFASADPGDTGADTGSPADTSVPADTGDIDTGAPPPPPPPRRGATDLGVGDRHQSRWIKQFGMDGDEEGFSIATGPEGTFVGGTTTSSWFGVFLDPCLDEEHAVARDCGDAIVFDTRTGVGVQTGDLASDETRALVVGDGLVTFAGRSRDPVGLMRQGGFVTQYTSDLLVEVFDARMAKCEFLDMAMAGGISYPAGGTLFEWQAPEPNVGSEDFLAMRVSAAGAVETTQQIGTTEFDELHEVAIDETGIYLAGTTEGTFGAASLGEEDGVLIHWSTTLEEPGEVCRIQFGTQGRDGADGIAVQGDFIYIGGNTGGALNHEYLDGSTCYHEGVDELPDAYISKFDKACQHVWTRQWGGLLGDAVESLAVDGEHVYAVGYANAGIDHVDEPREPTTDGFLRIYTLDGALSGEILFDSSASPDDQRVDYARAVTVDDTFVYVTGMTEGAMGFEPSAGGRDIFVAKVPIEKVAGNVRYEGEGCAEAP